MLISEDYRAEQAALHAKGNYGTASLQYGATVRELLLSTRASSLLDYGCGSKRSLRQALELPPDVVYEGYDPAIPAYAEPPIPAELVCCIDVLEHIEPQLLDNVLDHLADLSDPYGFFTVHTGPARKVLSDGRNAHLTQEGLDWWLPRFKKRFEVLAINPIPSGFAVVVRSLKSKASLPPPGKLVLPHFGFGSMTPVGPAPSSVPTQGQLVFKHGGHRIAIGAGSAVGLGEMQGRLKTESGAIEWLAGMPDGALFLDVGVGVGVHSLYAAACGAVVWALEPDLRWRTAFVENLASNRGNDRVTVLPFALNGANDATTLDQLVATGTIPQPAFVRVDAGELTPQVLRGAERLLSDPRVASVLIKTEGLHSREEIGQVLSSFGLAPVDLGIKGGATYQAFRRALAPWARAQTLVMAPTGRGRAVLTHVLERLAAAEVMQEPFPYAVIDDILPADYYAEALANFPSHASLRPLSETGRVSKGAYEERLVVLFTDDEFARMTPAQQRFWTEFAAWMYSDQFINAFISKFSMALEPRLSKILAASDTLKVKGDALLVNDQTNYAVGPHTDAPHRLVTFLFYLPRDDSMRDLGTSVYRPKDPDFVCWGGPHHSFEKFDHVRTVEFLPNRLLAFPKTERSFHGVEKIERNDVNRPLLINNIRVLNVVTH